MCGTAALRASRTRRPPGAWSFEGPGGGADWVSDPQPRSPLGSGSGHNHRATSCFVRSAPSPVPVSNPPIQDTVQIPERSAVAPSSRSLLPFDGGVWVRGGNTHHDRFRLEKGCWAASAKGRVLLDETPDLAARHLRSKQNCRVPGEE